jgi:hypothetical protein
MVHNSKLYGVKSSTLIYPINETQFLSYQWKHIYIYIYTHTYIYINIYIMKYYSAIKNNEITNYVVCKLMDGTGEHHVKWSKPESKSQRLHVFPHRWKLDL